MPIQYFSAFLLLLIADADQPKKLVPGFDFYPSECSRWLYSAWFVVVFTTGDRGHQDLKFHFERCFVIMQVVQSLLHCQKY